MTDRQLWQQIERDPLLLLPSLYASEITGGLLWIRRK